MSRFLTHSSVAKGLLAGSVLLALAGLFVAPGFFAFSGFFAWGSIVLQFSRGRVVAPNPVTQHSAPRFRGFELESHGGEWVTRGEIGSSHY